MFFVAILFVKSWKITKKDYKGVGKLYVSLQLHCWAIL